MYMLEYKKGNIMKHPNENLRQYVYLIQKGRMHEKKNELFEAKQSFENAISIHPAHMKSLQHLVRTSVLLLF